MNIILILAAVFSFAANSITIRTFQIKCERKSSDTYIFQSFFCVVAFVAYAISGKFNFNLTFFQFLSAVLFGIFFAMAVFFSAECYMCGPMSITSVIVNSSVIIPVLYSCIALKESISLTQIIGCLLLIVTFVLSSFQNSTDKCQKINLKWIVFVFIAFVSNGITAVIQKIYKISAPFSDGNIFMSVAYLTAAFILLIAFAIKRINVQSERNTISKILPVATFLVIIAGLGSFVGNGILMSLSTKVPAALLYPFLNGGLCVTVSAFSIIIFREKLNIKKAITILLGLSAVIILNL